MAHVESLQITIAQDCNSEDLKTLAPERIDVRCVSEPGGRFLVISTEAWTIDANDIDGFVDRLRQAVVLAEKA